MRLDSLTSKEFKKAMARKPVVILPIGGTEAHGAHLPLCTDSVQPEMIAYEVAEKIDGLVAPPLRYAFHSSTKNMPGTLSLGFETTIKVVQDILGSLVQNGADKLVALSGHAGSSHLAALRQACAGIVTAHPEVKVMLLTDYDLARKFSAELKGDGHGGLVETSRMLDLEPGLVKKATKVGRYVSQGYMIVADPERSMPDGFVGDATKATGEFGREINEYIVEQLVAEIRAHMGGAK